MREGEGGRGRREGEKERGFSMIISSPLCTYRAATVIATSEGVLWALVSTLYSITYPFIIPTIFKLFCLCILV